MQAFEHDFPIVDSEEILLNYYGYDINEATKSDWYQISQLELSTEFAEKYQDNIDWEEQFKNYILDEKILRKYIPKIETQAVWFYISYHYKLSPEFIWDFQKKLDPTVIVQTQVLPIKLILKWAKNEDNVDLIEDVFENQRITSNLLEKLIKLDASVDWYKLSKQSRVTKQVLRKYSHKIIWNVFSRDRELSEDTLFEFKNEVDWTEVSKNQEMSKDFILKMYNYVDIKALKQNEKVDQKMLEDEGVYVYLNLMQA